MKSLSIVGSNALSLREIILKNKNDFAPKTYVLILYFVFSYLYFLRTYQF